MPGAAILATLKRTKLNGVTVRTRLRGRLTLSEDKKLDSTIAKATAIDACKAALNWLDLSEALGIRYTPAQNTNINHTANTSSAGAADEAALDQRVNPRCGRTYVSTATADSQAHHNAHRSKHNWTARWTVCVRKSYPTPVIRFLEIIKLKSPLLNSTLRGSTN